RWVLSTNTDMVFVPQRRADLNQIVAKLPDGFYHAPRIEIPEALWESLDRRKPQQTIETIRNWGQSLHINEIVLGADVIRYDGPGDFQLMTRADLFKIHSFDEKMLLGWHVDSNIAKRLSFIYGSVGDLGREIFGYHCDHTRQITPAHSSLTRTENDWRIFVTDVKQVEIIGQANTWGCANDEIEEIQLQKDTAQFYVSALSDAIGEALKSPKIVKYTGETYNKVGYDAKHLLPFLADLIVSAPKRMNVAWYGGRLDILKMFSEVWQKLGFTGGILTDTPLLGKIDLAKCGVMMGSEEIIDSEANAFIFDFGFSSEGDKSRSVDEIQKISDGLRLAFLRTVRREQEHIENGLLSRRVIALNVIHNSYEQFVLDFITAGLTPFSTRMRHGFVRPRYKGTMDWLPFMLIGEAGRQKEWYSTGTKPVIKSAPGRFGHVAYGPFRHLSEGSYRLIITCDSIIAGRKYFDSEPCIVITVISNETVLAFQPVLYKDLERGKYECRFYVSTQTADSIAGIEARVRITSPMDLAIHELVVERLPDSEPVTTTPIFLQVGNWLPYLHRHNDVQHDETGVVTAKGTIGYAVWGPYWPLPAGSYQLLIDLARLDADTYGSHLGNIEIVAGRRFLASLDVHLNSLSLRQSQAQFHSICVPFDISEDDLADRALIETRFVSSGEVGFRIRSVRVMACDPGTMQTAPIPLGSENWL